MSRVSKWFKRRFKELDLLEKYFPLLFTRWQAAIWGGSVLAVAFGWHFITSDWPHFVKLSACVVALFFAGYYLWRADHIRLLPKCEIKQWTTLTTETLDEGRHINGWSIYYQLIPKCLSEANVEECHGVLTSIEMWDEFQRDWETKDNEALPLEWSYAGYEPITLHPKAEKHLNVFFIHSSNQQITPCVYPPPVRFVKMFNQLPLQQVKAIRFNIRLIAKDTPGIGLALEVTLDDKHPMRPQAKLEQVA